MPKPYAFDIHAVKRIEDAIVAAGPLANFNKTWRFIKEAYPPDHWGPPQGRTWKAYLKIAGEYMRNSFPNRYRKKGRKDLPGQILMFETEEVEIPQDS